jgi:tetratricopeptide (TPR) repeat protein
MEEVAHLTSLLTGSVSGRGRRLAGGAAALIAALLPLAAVADAFERTWCEIDTGEFRLITDHPREAAEDMVWRLRTFRPVAERYLPGAATGANRPLTVVVFRRAGDFRRAIGGAEVVGFMQPSYTENLMVVGPDPHAHSKHESLLHEYVHYLLRTRSNINIPAWFDEGLASMLSSAQVERREDGVSQVVVGALPASTLETSIDASRLTLSGVLEAEDLWEWHRDRRLGFYAWSWVLVHRLILGQQAGHPDYRPAVTAFLAEHHDSLPDALEVSAPALERRLERYLSRSPATVSHDIEATVDGPGRYRCLDDSEKIRQLSRAIVQQNPALAVRRLRDRIEADPNDAALWTTLSLAEESADDREAALAAARRALELAPQDVSAAVQLSGALAMGCILQVSEECRARWQEAVPLLRQALRRDPTRHDAIFILGLAYLYSGRAGDALNYLRIAHQSQPWAPHLNFYLGETYRLIGDARAREHLTRARQWSPTVLWRKMAEAGLERLQSG